jgi:hypothetical protein
MLLISCVAFLSCKDTQIYFNGETFIVDTNIVPDTLQGQKIKLDGIYTGGMWAHDTLIGFISGKFQNYFMHVFNVNTGEFLYPLCKRGIGPDEFPELTWTNQTVYDEESYLWIRKERSRDECVLINLGKTGDVIKQKIDIKIETEFFSFSFVFILNDSLFLANNQGEQQYQGEGSFIPPAYHLYNVHTKKKIKSYEPYNAFIPLSDKFYDMALETDCYYSMDHIKPDKSKLAMAMYLMDQINILDLTTGKIKGYRNKIAPDFNYLRDAPSDLKAYYIDLCVDDKYIYGFYSSTNEFRGNMCSNLINVFDWDGNVIKKIVLDRIALQSAFDPVNKYLYIDTLDEGEDEEVIYRYDMSYMYK